MLSRIAASLPWLAWIAFLPLPARAGDAAALQARILDAVRSGQKKVVVPPGRYLLSADGRPACLVFSRLRDVEIDATGAEFVDVDRSAVVHFDRCEGVTLRGAVIRHDPVPFSQGQIEAVAADRASLDVRVAPGYPDDLDDRARFLGDGQTILNVFDPATRLWKDGAGDAYVGAVERLAEPGLFRFRLKAPLSPRQAVAAGDLAAWRGNGAADVTLHRCARMALVDVRIESGAGFCVHEQGGEGGSFYRYVVTRGPAPAGASEPPLLACNADAFHSTAVRKGPTLENCLFEYMDDDGVPIHGAYALVAAGGDAPVLGATLPGFCRAGDTLRFYDEGGAFLGTAAAREVSARAGWSPAAPYRGAVRAFREAKGLAYAAVTLDPPLPVQAGWIAANADATGNGFAVRRCTIRNNRARGMLIKASDGVVEDCLIEGTTMAGIALWPEIGYWNESDFSHGVVLRRNVLRRVALWDDEANPMAGALSIGASEGHGFVASQGGHRDIVVEGNRFEENDGPNVVVSTAWDIQLRDNRFVAPMRRPSRRGLRCGVDPSSLVWITESFGVHAGGNAVDAAGPFLKKTVAVTPSVHEADLESLAALAANP